MHKISKPAASASAHFLGSRPGNSKHCFTCINLSNDPNWIMAALFMDLLVGLTCKCLILFKTMLFVCAWVLTKLLPRPVYAWKQMSPLSVLGGKKRSVQYCLKLSCNYNNTAYATVFNSKFHSVFERNQLNYFLLQSVSQVICKRLVSKRMMLLHLLYHPHRLGF